MLQQENIIFVFTSSAVSCSVCLVSSRGSGISTTLSDSLLTFDQVLTKSVDF